MLGGAALLPPLSAQSSPPLAVAALPRVTAVRNAAAMVRLPVQLRNGYHVNSHTPSESYLVPLRLDWNSPPLEVLEIGYPQPQTHTYSFSAKPLSVYTTDFAITTRFGVPATAPLGMTVVSGKLRYQACNDSSCLPPRTVEVKVSIDIRSQ